MIVEFKEVKVFDIQMSNESESFLLEQYQKFVNKRGILSDVYRDIAREAKKVYDEVFLDIKSIPLVESAVGGQFYPTLAWIPNHTDLQELGVVATLHGEYTTEEVL